jgi:phenylalanine-4-hydroxylase
MLRQLNDTVKHGAAAGDEQRPERADWTIDQGWSSYTAQDHAVWEDLVRAPEPAFARPRLR